MIFNTKKNLINIKRKKFLAIKKLKLECFKLKYFNYKVIINYKNYIKNYKYNIYKVLTNYSVFQLFKNTKI